MKELKDYILTENNFFKNLGIGKRQLIEKWIELYKRHIPHAIINDDLTIDASYVSLSKYPDEELPEYIQFNTVENFYINNSLKLKTLKGCPQKCTGAFNCSGCPNLISLKGAPKECELFSCANCSGLMSLEYLPKKCDHYICYGCGGKFTREDIVRKYGITKYKSIRTLK